MIRILIVDDSTFLRRILKDILKEDKEIIVVGEAKNGKEAIAKIPLLKPDLITLDVEMPIMDGIVTLKQIINDYSIPVIMLSSFTTEGATLTLEALEEGAVDFIPKPKNIFGIEGKKVKEDIIKKIKVAVKSNIDTKFNNLNNKKPFHKYYDGPIVSDKRFEYLVAIGTSTGGPRALQEVIPMLPKNINGAIVIVQHMPPKFTKSLAERLNKLSNINVMEGIDGTILKRGWCYIAPGDFHMKVVKDAEKYIIKLDKGPPVKMLRPSVDVLMESIAKIDNIKKLGVIMTGMGSDGSNGIVQIKKSNGYIIAQDKESSTVFGMPKVAIETKCVDKIVSLGNVADEIIRIVGV